MCKNTYDNFLLSISKTAKTKQWSSTNAAKRLINLTALCRLQRLTTIPGFRNVRFYAQLTIVNAYKQATTVQLQTIRLRREPTNTQLVQKCQRGVTVVDTRYTRLSYICVQKNCFVCTDYTHDDGCNRYSCSASAAAR